MFLLVRFVRWLNIRWLSMPLISVYRIFLFLVPLPGFPIRAHYEVFDAAMRVVEESLIKRRYLHPSSTNRFGAHLCQQERIASHYLFFGCISYQQVCCAGGGADAALSGFVGDMQQREFRDPFRRAVTWLMAIERRFSTLKSGCLSVSQSSITHHRIPAVPSSSGRVV